MWKNLATRYIRLFNTVKYLKSIQIYYRLYYFIRARARKLIGFNHSLSVHSHSTQLKLDTSINSYPSYENYQFSFLNLTKDFNKKIDWNYNKHGKLWTYNLTYFDYLHQKNISTNDGLKLIYNFMEQSIYIKDGLEPFPISLRGMNWIKFLSYNELKEQKINDSLYAQYKILMDNLEYHILGNHLLENGFSLLFGAYYFQDEKFYAKAREILFEELKNQILNDGAHFELSPMYHQIMLFRVLDCINLLQNNNWKDQELLGLLKSNAEVMLDWLNTITFENGNIPLLNDSANNIAPTTEQLNKYASILKVNYHPSKVKHQLNESGYRKFQSENYECVVDIGNIGPDYIPGHAHADTFNFELYINKKPFIVDTGISTYETNERRILERSTTSHNSVELDNLNQSEVWGGFRVANRAYVTILHENENNILAVHDGYKKRLNALHQREFIFENKSIKIIDKIISDNEHKAFARIHFHPSIDEGMIKKHIMLDNLNYTIKEYQYSPEFNVHINAKVLEISFIKNLEVKIVS